MKHTLNELFDIVYRHYPRGIPSDDPRYKETEEDLLLWAERQKASDDRAPWRALLRRLKDQFPDNAVQNRSLYLPMGKLSDACYAGALFLPPNTPGEHFHTVGFLMSILVPCYFVYTSRTVDDPTTTETRDPTQADNLCVSYNDTTFYLPADFVNIVKPDMIYTPGERPARRREISFEPSPEEQPYVAWIAQDIEASFGAERMPPEVGKVVVPDVATKHRTFGEATLYDCLLSDRW